MNMRTRSFFTVVLLAASGSSCSAQRLRDAKLLQQFARNGCNHRLTAVPIGPDQVSPNNACILATTALSYVARGASRELGILPADTAKLRNAVVSTFDVPYPDGEPTQHQWVVTFAVPGRNAGLAVIFDRVTGTVEAKLSEPIDLRP